jgi:hypothetical protein
MRFKITRKLPVNELVLMNRLGYHVHRDRHANAPSYTHRLGGMDYPRFHVYLERFGEDLIVNLHLDEKRPSYAGSNRHSGQYDSEQVSQEALRIQYFIEKL